MGRARLWLVLLVVLTLIASIGAQRCATKSIAAPMAAQTPDEISARAKALLEQRAIAVALGMTIAAPPRADGRGPPSGMGFGGRGGGEPPPIGTIVTVKGGLASAIVESATQKSVAIPRLPRTRNTAIAHDAAGILGASGPNTFYLTLQKNTGLDGKYAAIGKVIGGLSRLPTLQPGEPVRSIRITRVGQAARDVKTDDEAFKALMAGRK